MSKEKEIIILLQRLLNQSRHDKLMYLNTADRQNLPTYKRFLNQQAIIRNSMFYKFSALLSDYGIEAEEVFFKRSDIHQLMRTTIKREKTNPFEKCLEQDHIFRTNLMELMTLDTVQKNQEIYHKQLVKIEACISENEFYSEEFALKDLTSSDLLN